MPVTGPRGGKHANSDQMKMRQVWRTKGWKARVRELLLEFERCEWCNGKSGHVNHRRQGYYEGYELCRRDEVDVICKTCHEEWTKTGKKRHRLYDDCKSCAAPIYRGRKKCWLCGGEVAGKRLLDLMPEKRRRLFKIAAKCREVALGDVWEGVWMWTGPVKVMGWKAQDDLPWPLVVTDRGEVGLPAFNFGTLVKAGRGEKWMKALEETV